MLFGVIFLKGFPECVRLDFAQDMKKEGAFNRKEISRLCALLERASPRSGTKLMPDSKIGSNPVRL